MHAYVITPTSPVQQKLIEPDQLVSPFPFQMRSVNGLTTHGNMTVVLKHGICFVASHSLYLYMKFWKYMILTMRCSLIVGIIGV